MSRSIGETHIRGGAVPTERNVVQDRCLIYRTTGRAQRCARASERERPASRSIGERPIRRENERDERVTGELGAEHRDVGAVIRIRIGQVSLARTSLASGKPKHEIPNDSLSRWRAIAGGISAVQPQFPEGRPVVL